jgi:hypothetical protein
MMMDCFALLQDGYRILLSTGLQEDGLFAWKVYLCQATSPVPGALVAAGARYLTRDKAEQAGMTALMEYRAMRADSTHAGELAAAH